MALKPNFQRSKLFTGKTPLFVIGPFRSRKTSVFESLFVGRQFSCEICKVFKKAYFEEHLLMTASVHFVFPFY